MKRRRAKISVPGIVPVPVARLYGGGQCMIAIVKSFLSCGL